MACCPSNESYVATVGRPSSTLKITNIKCKQTLVTANLEVISATNKNNNLRKKLFQFI